MNKTNFGYLRETQESAIKAGKDPSNGMCRTGLECYLKAIFPDVDDWIHDKPIKLKGRLYRPDYRSESLKLIVEFDGMHHYHLIEKSMLICFQKAYHHFLLKIRIPPHICAHLV